MGPGEDLLRADERAAEREAPGIRVEHRHDGEDGVALRQPEQPDGGERVDRDRAMRVDDALGKPRRPAREAHRGRCALVDVAIRERALVRRGEELLVVDRTLGRLARPDGDDVLEADAVDELRCERPEHLVDDEHLVAGVRGDVGVVVGMETQVERVRDEAADRRPDVRLEVLVVVPHEGGDAVAVFETQAAKCHRETLRPRREVGIAVAVPALVRKPGDDLAVAVELVRPPQDRGHVQLVVHHQAVHHASPLSSR